MAKGKVKGTKGPAQKHLHSRISYLYQAATYLANSNLPRQEDAKALGQEHPENAGSSQVEHDTKMSAHVPQTGAGKSEAPATKASKPSHDCIPPVSRRMLNNLRSVSLKSQIRLTPIVKHSICKRCDNLLIPGSSCTNRLENLSRGGKKPWADVFIMTCMACGTEKRFPVGSARQERRSKRLGAERKAP